LIFCLIDNLGAMHLPDLLAQSKGCNQHVRASNAPSLIAL
jgi:hypothetical protein